VSAARVLANAGRWFDPDWYKSRNPDVARAGIDPLTHYLRYGDAEGRFPSVWFNPAWYRAVHGVSADQSALEHFLSHRHTGDVLPCPELYLVPRSPPWRDAIAYGSDPFDRYLAAMEIPERELLPELFLIQSCGLIDAMYFHINATDPHERALDPGLHYCRFGWRHGAKPNTAFDPDWYAETNPEVARLGINPLVHYVLEGEPSSRRPVPWFDPAWYRSEYGVPPDCLALAHYLQQRGGGMVSPNALFDTGWYVARHSASIPPEVDPFSHYLLTGALRDIDPSPRFNASAWRHRHMAPPAAPGQAELSLSARNPLVHYLRLVHARR
jgi:hypothetical protein